MLRRTTTLVLATLTLASGACGSQRADAPPPIAPPPTEASAGVEAPPAPAPSGVDEGEAVNIAMQLAEQQGYDLALYEDITVHEGEAGTWLAQMRRPMATRFLEVTVDTQSGAAELVQRATSY